MVNLPAFMKLKAKVRLNPARIKPDDAFYSLLNLTGTVEEIELQAELRDENRGKKDKNGHPKPPSYLPGTRNEPNGYVVVRFETTEGVRHIHAHATDFEPVT